MRGVYYLVSYKTKISTLLMYGVLNKDAIKSEILLPLVSGKMRLCFKKGFSEVIKCFLGKLIAGCQ